MPLGNSLCLRVGALAIATVALAGLLAAAPSWAASRPVGTELSPLAEPSVRTARGDFASGEAIVRFERGVSAAERRQVRRDADVEFGDVLALPRTEAVEVDGSVAAAVRRLERQPGVAYAQPNYRYEALAVEPPDDSFFGQLWGLKDPALPDPGVSVLEAWEDREGVDQVNGAGQVIAVLDTGVDLTHPDLEANLWANASEAAGNDDDDDDGNGQVDDIHGYDFIDDDGDPDDYQFHGTHVAGTAAAIADNEEGIAGVAPEAAIMAVRVLDGDGSGLVEQIVEGIVYAAENGADVINMSLGGSPSSKDQLTEDAIEFAAAKDVVVVAAAGNSGANNDVALQTPCALPQANLICVAALNQTGALAGFSNYGPQSVDIAAPGGGFPGTGILSAKTDYETVFTEDFEDGVAGWESSTEDSSIPWGPSDVRSEGVGAVADSPGSGVNYAPNSDTQLIHESPVSLTDERGCRLHFDLRREIQPKTPGGAFTDFLLAGAVTSVPSVDQALPFAGSSGGLFQAEEVSISGLDGEADVFPAFALFSDATDQRDGAYVDDARLLCRDETYSPPEADNYVRFSGTSMAAPHVAGVVALVRAAAPSLSAVDAVGAVLAGASAIPKPNATRHIATEGIADACQAIAVATGAVTVECPGSSENVPFQPPAEPPLPPGGPAPAPPISEQPIVDRQAPQTLIRRRPPRVVRTGSNRARVVFRFGSNEAGVTFVCRIDGGFFRPCGQRLVRRFRIGVHVVRVKARDQAGNVDPTPAVFRFRVEPRN